METQTKAPSSALQWYVVGQSQAAQGAVMWTIQIVFKTSSSNLTPDLNLIIRTHLLSEKKSPGSYPHHPPSRSLGLCLSVDAALSVSLSLLQYWCDCVVLKLRSLRIHPSPVCVASRCLNTKQRGLNDDVAQSCSPHRMIRVIQTDGLGPRLPAGFLRDWKRTEALDSPSTRLRYIYMHVNTER